MSETSTTTDYRSFKELKSYKKARAIRKEIFELCKTFPPEEKYRLCDQIIRSSRSITANIAEGHGRYHYQENVQYCRIARGSTTETDDHFAVALDCQYIDDVTYKKFEKQLLEVERILNGYIKFLQKQKKLTR